MLNEQEIKDFLALLLAFALATGSSGRDCADYFNVTPNTMCRWIKAARHNNEVAEDKILRAYWIRVEPIIRRIKLMNDYNDKHGVYARIRGAGSSSERKKQVAALLAKLKPQLD